MPNPPSSANCSTVLALLALLLLAGCSTVDLERAAAEWGRSLCQTFGDCRPGCGDGRSGSSYCR